MLKRFLQHSVLAAKRRSLSSNSMFTRSLPGTAFVDPKLYEIERQHLLGPSWQLFGHESQFLSDSSNPPATFVAETICGWPTIVVRSSKTGQFHAYHNVCRHKAGPLQWNNTAGACELNGLKCKYHGWAYSLDGRLVGVPSFCDSGEKLDRSEFNLWPMRVALWRGLIFVQTLPNSASDPYQGVSMTGDEANAAFVRDNFEFCAHLSGSIHDNNDGSKSSISGLPLEDFEFHSSNSHKIKCNWKVILWSI